MEEDLFQPKQQRQTVDPRVDIINKSTEPVLKVALDEFGFKLPLTFMLYNQIRFYEEFGKLKIGFNVASKETLADQFGVSVKQIERAYNNLTTKYKLGKWIENDQPIYRNVTRTWVSNERLKDASSYYSVVPELLQRSSTTTTVEYLASEVRPLSESKKKVSESKKVSKDTLAKAYGSEEINGLFDYWSVATGLPITSKLKLNRNACNNLLKRYGKDKVQQLINGVAQAQADKYAPRISDFVSLQAKLNDLLLWGKQKSNTGKVVKI